MPGHFALAWCCRFCSDGHLQLKVCYCASALCSIFTLRQEQQNSRKSRKKSVVFRRGLSSPKNRQFSSPAPALPQGHPAPAGCKHPPAAGCPCSPAADAACTRLTPGTGMGLPFRDGRTPGGLGVATPRLAASAPTRPTGSSRSRGRAQAQSLPPEGCFLYRPGGGGGLPAAGSGAAAPVLCYSLSITQDKSEIKSKSPTNGLTMRFFSIFFVLIFPFSCTDF